MFFSVRGDYFIGNITGADNKATLGSQVTTSRNTAQVLILHKYFPRSFFLDRLEQVAYRKVAAALYYPTMLIFKFKIVPSVAGYEIILYAVDIQKSSPEKNEFPPLPEWENINNG